MLADPDLDMTSSMSKEKRSRSRSHSDFEEAMDGLNNDFDSVTFDAEDINFYLRLGAISESFVCRFFIFFRQAYVEPHFIDWYCCLCSSIWPW